MSEETGREPSAGRTAFGWSSLWQRVRRALGLSGKPKGDEDRWTWFGEESPTKRAGTRRLLLVGEVAAGIALLLGGVLFVLLRTGDAGGPDPAPPAVSTGRTDAPSPSGAPTVAPTLTAAPSSPTQAVSPAPSGPEPAFRLSVWDAENNLWETDDLTVARPTSGDGQSIPFLLNIDDAVPGQNYNVQLTYECKAGQEPGLEFLTGYDRDSGQTPATVPPGPGRPFPDAAAAFPDDASTPSDDGQPGRVIRVWGATPEGGVSAPVPATACVGEKSVFVRVRALAGTIHLLWGAGLGAAQGEAGTSGTEARLAMRASIEGIRQGPDELSVIVPG